MGQGASIHADIKAGEVQIHGSVSGMIDGYRRVEIFATGRVHGDIRTPQLVVEEGGRFDGRSRSTSGEGGGNFADSSYIRSQPGRRTNRDALDGSVSTRK